MLQMPWEEDDNVHSHTHVSVKWTKCSDKDQEGNLKRWNMKDKIPKIKYNKLDIKDKSDGGDVGDGDGDGDGER